MPKQSKILEISKTVYLVHSYISTTGEFQAIILSGFAMNEKPGKGDVTFLKRNFGHF